MGLGELLNSLRYKKKNEKKSSNGGLRSEWTKTIKSILFSSDVGVAVHNSFMFFRVLSEI